MPTRRTKGESNCPMRIMRASRHAPGEMTKRATKKGSVAGEREEDGKFLCGHRLGIRHGHMREPDLTRDAHGPFAADPPLLAGSEAGHDAPVGVVGDLVHPVVE